MIPGFTTDDLDKVLAALALLAERTTFPEMVEVLPAVLGALFPSERVVLAVNHGGENNDFLAKVSTLEKGELCLNFPVKAALMEATIVRETDFSRREIAMAEVVLPYLQRCLEAAFGRDQASQEAHVPELEAPAGIQKLVQLGLSKREAEVLWWLALGKVNKEIASILGVSFRTVQKHVENILRKLELENRHAAAVHAAAWLRCTLSQVKQASES